MALRPHRDLSLKQLSKLAKDSWSAPARLAEILDELRGRDDAAGQPLIRKIARRLGELNYRPPEKGGTAADETAADRRKDAAAQRRRRRILAIVLPMAAAAGVAIYLAREKPPASGVQAEAGLDVAGHNELRPGAASAAASAAAVITGDAAGGSSPPKRSLRRLFRHAVLPLRHLRPKHNPVAPAEPVRLDLPPTELAPKSVATALAEPELSTDAVPLPAPKGRRIAEDGIYIGQNRLHCYRSDRDPEDCGVDLWGPRTRPGPTPSARVINAEARAGIQQSRAAFAAPARPPAASIAPFRSSAAGQTDPMQPSPREPRGDVTRNRPPAPQCPPPPIGRTVFILDMSLSMGLPLSVDAALEDQLDEGVARKDPEARRRYRELLAEPGPKRVTRAREAFESAAKSLPDWVEMGLVVFRECKDIRKVGIYEAAARGQAVEYIRQMIPRGRTPIAQSLIEAATMLGDGPSSIVLLTDGREFCGGDPCAAAARLKTEHPQTPVSIVDISGQAKAECIAAATGGRVYTPSSAEDLGRVVYNAFRGADASCPAGPVAGLSPGTTTSSGSPGGSRPASR